MYRNSSKIEPARRETPKFRWRHTKSGNFLKQNQAKIQRPTFGDRGACFSHTCDWLALPETIKNMYYSPPNLDNFRPKSAQNLSVKSCGRVFGHRSPYCLVNVTTWCFNDYRIWSCVCTRLLLTSAQHHCNMINNSEHMNACTSDIAKGSHCGGPFLSASTCA